MKTRTLLIIGIIAIIAVSITSISLVYNQEIKLATGMMTSDEKPEPKNIPDPICFVMYRETSSASGGVITLDQCFPLNDFENLGCDREILDHIYKYTNLLDDEFDSYYYQDLIGYPDDLSQVEFDKCVSLILEIRTISNGVPELDPDPHPEPPPASTQCRPGLPTFTSDFYLDKELCKWKLIPEPIISEAIPYVWNADLQKRQIDFSPKDGSYINTDEGYFPEKETKVCSPLILSDGTKQYISSTFIIEPFEIIDTVMSDTQPDDCHKIWKTDTLLVEPSPELGAWLEHYWEKENED